MGINCHLVKCKNTHLLHTQLDATQKYDKVAVLQLAYVHHESEKIRHRTLLKIFTKHYFLFLNSTFSSKVISNVSLVLYSSETCTMRRIDNDRTRSFHTQSYCHILLGVKCMTRVPMPQQGDNKAARSADRHHSIFSHIC